MFSWEDESLLWVVNKSNNFNSNFILLNDIPSQPDYIFRYLNESENEDMDESENENMDENMDESGSESDGESVDNTNLLEANI